MSEIKAGDLVQCVASSDGAENYLECGKVYVVEGLGDVPPHMRPSLKLLGVDKRWSAGRFVKIEAAAELAPSQGPSEPVAVDTDRVQCTWWERNGFVYDELAQRWVLPPATERAAREADTQAAWDRFAAAAMKGLFAGDTRKTMDPDEVCRLAAECADEMLVRRAASRAAIEKGGA